MPEKRSYVIPKNFQSSNTLQAKDLEEESKVIGKLPKNKSMKDVMKPAIEIKVGSKQPLKLNLNVKLGDKYKQNQEKKQ